jgi:hypothetical protein
MKKCRNCVLIDSARNHFGCTENERCLSNLCLVCWGQVFRKLDCECHLHGGDLCGRKLESIRCTDPEMSFQVVSDYVMTSVTSRDVDDRNRSINYFMSNLIKVD